MVSNEVYEQEIKRIAPRLEKLENKSFDRMMNGLYYDVLESKIDRTLSFALTYVLDPSKFYIEVNQRLGGYTVEFNADTPLMGLGAFAYIWAGSDKRPTDKEARDIIKKCLDDGESGIEVEGLIEKAKGVVNTCKVIKG